jgi:hypothetical protein
MMTDYLILPVCKFGLNFPSEDSHDLYELFFFLPPAQLVETNLLSVFKDCKMEFL